MHQDHPTTTINVCQHQQPHQHYYQLCHFNHLYIQINGQSFYQIRYHLHLVLQYQAHALTTFITNRTSMANHRLT